MCEKNFRSYINFDVYDVSGGKQILLANTPIAHVCTPVRARSRKESDKYFVGFIYATFYRKTAKAEHVTFCPRPSLLTTVSFSRSYIQQADRQVRIISPFADESDDARYRTRVYLRGGGRS